MNKQTTIINLLIDLFFYYLEKDPKNQQHHSHIILNKINHHDGFCFCFPIFTNKVSQIKLLDSNKIKMKKKFKKNKKRHNNTMTFTLILWSILYFVFSFMTFHSLISYSDGKGCFILSAHHFQIIFLYSVKLLCYVVSCLLYCEKSFCY